MPIDKLRYAIPNRCLQNKFCRIRVPYPFQWGAPTFDAGETFAMMAASLVALVEVYLLLFW